MPDPTLFEPAKQIRGIARPLRPAFRKAGRRAIGLARAVGHRSFARRPVAAQQQPNARNKSNCPPDWPAGRSSGPVPKGSVRRCRSCCC